MKNISIFRQKFELWEFCIFVLCVILFILLGNWQLNRLDEKRNFISKIEANIKAPPKQLFSKNTKLELYDKIEIKGHFLNDRNIFLYGRRSAYPEKDGYYLLTPFEDIFGDIYLVSRGWLPSSVKEKISSFQNPSEETIITFVMLGEQKKLFIPDNDIKHNIWFILDLKQAQEKFHLTNSDFYLMQENSANLPNETYPLTSKYLSVIRNDHMEYAITWYSLALILSVIYFIYNKNKLNNKVIRKT